MNSWFPRRNPDNREGEIISLEPIVGLRPIAAHKLESPAHRQDDTVDLTVIAPLDEWSPCCLVCDTA
jgi:hypothetical protein